MFKSLFNIHGWYPHQLQPEEMVTDEKEVFPDKAANACRIDAFSYGT